MADIFNQMLSRYEMRTRDDERNAIHEVMQQIALAGLYRANFFDKAAFYGGTCLRIFHDLQRFSQEMDFSLLKKDHSFSIETCFNSIEKEFEALGRKVEIYKKEKKWRTQVESAFLKDTTDMYDIRFQTEPSVRIKLEVDTDPPLGFQTEHRLLLLPFSFMTRCFTLPGLFAGKMHAFLFRSWGSRVKGRDWYDFEWYIRNQIPLDFSHFLERAMQSHSIESPDISKEDFRNMVRRRIENTRMEAVLEDVRPFTKNPGELEIWSEDYFLRLVDMIQFL